MRLVECVPNISEGRRREVWENAAATAANAPSVTLRNVYPREETNRTVIPSVGEPEASLEGTVPLTMKALDLMGISAHQGPQPPIDAGYSADCDGLRHV